MTRPGFEPTTSWLWGGRSTGVLAHPWWILKIKFPQNNSIKTLIIKTYVNCIPDQSQDWGNKFWLSPKTRILNDNFFFFFFFGGGGVSFSLNCNFKLFHTWHVQILFHDIIIYMLITQIKQPIIHFISLSIHPWGLVLKWQSNKLSFQYGD